MSGYGVSVRSDRDGQTQVAGALPSVTVKHGTNGVITLDVGTLSGGHVLHLAVAMCVFNDLFREARARGLQLEHVEVTADGSFDMESGPFRSTGVTYRVEVAGDGSEDDLRALVAHVEQIAEIPHALRQGMTVRMSDAKITRSSAVVR